MTAFYGRLVRRGDLVFDIGAHVGDRVLAFRRLGCRVVALEPQPALVSTLRLIYGRSPAVEIIHAAVSDRPGAIKLRLNRANPTVSTASMEFIEAAKDAPGWHGQHWDSEVDVRAVTLDSLIAAYGTPSFIKIDVEGLEDKVLAGLSTPIGCLSFEFTTHRREVAFRCVDRLCELGDYRFNSCLGESWTPVFPAPIEAKEMKAWLEELPAEANSGDVYAFHPV